VCASQFPGSDRRRKCGNVLQMTKKRNRNGNIIIYYIIEADRTGNNIFFLLTNNRNRQQQQKHQQQNKAERIDGLMSADGSRGKCDVEKQADPFSFFLRSFSFSISLSLRSRQAERERKRKKAHDRKEWERWVGVGGRSVFR